MFPFPLTPNLMGCWWWKGVRCELLGVNEVQELFTCLGIIPEDTQHGGSHSLAVNLLNTSHHHAHVPETQFTVNCLKNVTHLFQSNSCTIFGRRHYNVLEYIKGMIYVPQQKCKQCFFQHADNKVSSMYLVLGYSEQAWCKCKGTNA